MAEPAKVTPCTPDRCTYGPGHSCMHAFPENFPAGSSTVWRKRKDALLYGKPYPL